jgi:hypothetical protein
MKTTFGGGVVAAEATTERQERRIHKDAMLRDLVTVAASRGSDGLCIPGEILVFPMVAVVYITKSSKGAIVSSGDKVSVTAETFSRVLVDKFATDREESVPDGICFCY